MTISNKKKKQQLDIILDDSFDKQLLDIPTYDLDKDNDNDNDEAPEATNQNNTPALCTPTSRFTTQSMEHLDQAPRKMGKTRPHRYGRGILDLENQPDDSPRTTSKRQLSSTPDRQNDLTAADIFNTPDSPDVPEPKRQRTQENDYTAETPPMENQNILRRSRTPERSTHTSSNNNTEQEEIITNLKLFDEQWNYGRNTHDQANNKVWEQYTQQEKNIFSKIY